MDPNLEMKTGDEALQQSEQPAKVGGTVQRAGSIAFLASGLGPKICFSPDGLTDGIVADPAPVVVADPKIVADPKVVVDPAKVADPAKVDPAKVVKAERPEWLPESFWDTEKGFKKEDFDSLLASKAERDAAKAQVPEKPDGYAAKLPATFKLPDGFEQPQGEAVLNEDDPRIAALREVAHGKGWSQSDFEDVLAFGIHQDIAEQVRMKEAVGKEREKLGGRSKERISAVTTWLDAKLGTGPAATLHSMMFTAAQLEAFEALMRLNRGDVPGTPGASRGGGLGPSQIEGYDKMTFRQRMAAIDAMKSDN